MLTEFGKDGIDYTLYKHHCQCIGETVPIWSITTLCTKNTDKMKYKNLNKLGEVYTFRTLLIL